MKRKELCLSAQMSEPDIAIAAIQQLLSMPLQGANDCETCSSLLPAPLRLKPEVVIGFVRSDPEPVVLAVPFAGNRAVTPANFYGRRRPSSGIRETDALDWF